jgi:ABC-type hemin transport system ATPase subunit
MSEQMSVKLSRTLLTIEEGRGQCFHYLFLDEEANAFIIFFLMKMPMPSLSFS